MNSIGRNHHSHYCAFIEKHGNMEVEIERMGGEMGNEHKQPTLGNKTLNEYPNESYK